MKLQFDSSQEYQLDAVRSVVDLFEGQPLNKGDFEVSFIQVGSSLAYTDRGVANQLVLSPEQILENLRKVQSRNGLPESPELEGMNFTVEMETGTGKTYTYLRTIYELNKVYGFKKFVIVVPSIAIREGTYKNLQITEEHFQAIYNNRPCRYWMYDSKRLSDLRTFAAADSIQILVINIDSFTRDTTIINQVRESGVMPIEYIQSANPIVIVDEPQNMESDIRRDAIARLNPLCTLRYSATHRNLYNLLYKLDPVQAYDLGLVKQIEVDGITADANHNAAYIQFEGIQKTKTKIRAKLRIYANEGTGVKAKSVKAEPGDDLFDLSNERDMYREGFILNRISGGEEGAEGWIEFSNGLVIREGQTQGGLTDEVMKYQIERTISRHFEKERRLGPKGIKVLTLFFIDRVANYREYATDGTPIKGKFAEWFEEIFARYAAQPMNRGVIAFDVEEVHNGYFSQDKGRFKDSNGETKADNDTYSLIMREKERLLDPAEPLRFIFSHTALREGWDNPNVFQICTLNETASALKKRQEIGRGLRLPVDDTGERIFDKNINVLTVVANENYNDFARQLQTEIEEESGVTFEGRIKNAREKGQIRRTKELTEANFPEFFAIWNRIKHRTRYRVEYGTDTLIERSATMIREKMPKVSKPKIVAQNYRLDIGSEGIRGVLRDSGVQEPTGMTWVVPDPYGYIQSKLSITRRTIYQILKESGRLNELPINPQLFLDNVIMMIKNVLNELMVDGIKYEQIAGRDYEMRLFENEEIETYLSNLFEVTRPEKTLYNYVPTDSAVERRFAQECEADGNVKFFFKLPRGFRIPTPIGTYNPDWAVVFENDRRIYFVAETKSTLNPEQLRGVEGLKIACGKEHFALFSHDGVQFRQVTQVKELYD